MNSGPWIVGKPFFDALFVLDETVQFGFADRPISLRSVRERLDMHSAAEEAAIEERKAKEAEAEKIRRKKEAEFAAQKDLETGIGTGALGLFNKAKGWLGLGEARPEKKSGAMGSLRQNWRDYGRKILGEPMQSLLR